MPASVDILPNAAFVVLWLAFLRFYWVTFSQWQTWQKSPENDPAIAIDVRRRAALKSMFRKYEEYRQVESSAQLAGALQDLTIPPHDLPPTDNLDDQGRIRQNVAFFMRGFEEELQAVVGDELALGPMATGEGRFGPEIAQFDLARRESRRIAFQKFRGRVCIGSALLTYVVAFLTVVGAALVIAFQSNLTLTVTGWPLLPTLLATAWLSLAIAIGITLLFAHFVISQSRVVAVHINVAELLPGGTTGQTAGPEPGLGWKQLISRMSGRS